GDRRHAAGTGGAFRLAAHNPPIAGKPDIMVVTAEPIRPEPRRRMRRDHEGPRSLSIIPKSLCDSEVLSSAGPESIFPPSLHRSSAMTDLSTAGTFTL